MKGTKASCLILDASDVHWFKDKEISISKFVRRVMRCYIHDNKDKEQIDDPYKSWVM